MELDDMRHTYGRLVLREENVDPDPFRQFAVWMRQAQDAGIEDPNAMGLATATPDGKPSVRMVLLRGMDAARGFLFFTNYQSRKAQELTANPRAALLFYWDKLARQVRAEGRVLVAAPEVSDAYFESRPFGSRLSAVVSPQSQVVPDRQALEQKLQELQAAHPDERVPRPAHWGGYHLIPEVFEFWQGGEHRLHDRLRYTPAGDGQWRIERLAP